MMGDLVSALRVEKGDGEEGSNKEDFAFFFFFFFFLGLCEQSKLGADFLTADILQHIENFGAFETDEIEVVYELVSPALRV